MIDDLDFVGDLGSADDGDEGLDGIGDGLAEVGQLLFKQEAGGGLPDVMGDALGRGVGAVSGAEGVVDVEIAEAGEGFGELWVVALFLRVEAEVFKEQGLAGLELGGELGGDFADAIRGEGDVFGGSEDVIEELAQAVDDGPETHRLVALAFGAAEVRAKDDLGFVADGVLDGRDGLADARVVEDLAAVRGERDVEVDADEDTLVGQVEVADGELGHGMRISYCV